MPSDTAIKAKTETITVKVDDKVVTVPRLSPDYQGKLTPTTMIQACGRRTAI